MPKMPDPPRGLDAPARAPELVFPDSQKPAKLSLVNDFEWKQLEGQRIMAALGGVAAVPGAGLISTGPAGAPLFAASLMLAAAAYACWLFTDGIYHVSVQARDLIGKFQTMLPAFKSLGVPLSRMTVVYAVASVLCTIGGFFGAHGSWRTPVSVEWGFLITLALSIVVGGHVLWVQRKLSRLRSVLLRYSLLVRKRNA